MQPASDEQRHPDDQVKSQLRLAARRLEDAQRERITTIVAAKRAGLFIRRIVEHTGLSSSRVHQFLQEHADDGQNGGS